MDEGKTIDEVGPRAREASLERCGALEATFADRPDLLPEAARLAEMADLKIEIGRPHFPRLNAAGEESVAKLRALCMEALPARYGDRCKAARSRLARELDIIASLGLADYFLVVADIVGFAAGRGIPVACRGSGAGSVVAYLAGIAQVDPIGEGLIFERFLNELRPDYPDIDIDISWRRRDEVIAHVYERFGTANVAMISTRACFEVRLAAREVAKAFGLSPYEAQALADHLPYHGSRDPGGAILRALGHVKPELAEDQRDAIAHLAAAIVGFPNHSSVHCGGIVVADRPITYYTPLEIAAKGVQVTQFDMRSIEKIGLIKIDLLGNRVLSVIEETASDIAQRGRHLPDIPPDDSRTASLLARGATLSCFQLESPAMRNLLRMLRARTRADATLALALVRPGPAAGGMKQQFIRRRTRGPARGPSDRDGVELPVFEEDVMRLVASHTGVGLAEAEIFRRSLKASGPDNPSLEAKFLFLAETCGTDRARALEAWGHIKRFAAYTFSKAHAVSFGMLAYTAAYLKAHFPLEFYAAVLRNHSGMYPLWAHVNEARRLGISVLPPSVACSQADFAIEGGAIRTGLKSIKHLADETTHRLIEERQHSPFRSLADFLDRVPASRDEVLALVGSGAFDTVEPARWKVLAEYLASRGRVRGAGALCLGLADVPTNLPVQALTDLQMRRMEYAGLGFSPLMHPLAFFDEPTDTAAGGPGRAREGSVEVRGVLAACRHYRHDGTAMWFASLDNPGGIDEILILEGVPADRLQIGGGYVAWGRVEKRFGAPTVRAHAFRSLPERED